MDNRPESVSAAMAGIVSYLESHPDARDTPEGIRRWWLVAVSGEFTDMEVIAALAQLLQHDRVTRMTLPDGTELFARGSAIPD